LTHYLLFGVSAVKREWLNVASTQQPDPQGIPSDLN
jgi:hypothetical protein